MQNLLVLCDLETLREHHCLGLDPLNVGKDEIFAIYRNDNVYVYKNRCPHEPVAMEFRKHQFLSKDKSQIICFAHGARFEIESGQCIHGPCIGEKLTQIPHQLINGIVYVSNDEINTRERMIV